MFRHERPQLGLKPESGRTEPRLWVRRLVIWKDAHTPPLRDVKLRPGLNIIWSPDASEGGDATGHGGGKTTFCRLLRFCLGEDSFAPKPQVRRTVESLPAGRVGAEVRLDGRDWTVVRGFSGANEDWAAPDAPMGYAVGALAPTGMEPLRIAITTAFLAPVVDLLPSKIGEQNAWAAVLAWLTRDQECRFSHLLDWRAKDSDSHSPVRNLSKDDQLLVVRACVGALRAEELTARAEQDRAGELASQAQRRHDLLAGQTGMLRRDLASLLGLNPELPASELDARLLLERATARHSALLATSPMATPQAIRAARDADRKAEHELRVAGEALGINELLRKEREQEHKLVSDQLPELASRTQNILLCPLCKVPIDRALAEGCSITIHPCDLDKARVDLAAARSRRREVEIDCSNLAAENPLLKQRLALADQRRLVARRRIDQLLAAVGSRSEAERHADRLVGDAERLIRLLANQEDAARTADEESRRKDALKGRVEAHRDRVADVLRVLNARFDAVLNWVVPDEVRGRATLDGNGLNIQVNKGGDCVAAAIESLKVVLFDVAVLTLAIEGEAQLPSLMIHDSPREADLGLSIYHQLFPLLAELETCGPQPLFQYVMTTTTAPPKEFQKEPWHRLTLRGAPASERLFGMDL